MTKLTRKFMMMMMTMINGAPYGCFLENLFCSSLVIHFHVGDCAVDALFAFMFHDVMFFYTIS